MRLRDLERPAFMQEARQLIEDLRRDATTLYRFALRLEIRARTPDVDLAAFGASTIRRRLVARSYGVHTSASPRTVRGHRPGARSGAAAPAITAPP